MKTEFLGTLLGFCFLIGLTILLLECSHERVPIVHLTASADRTYAYFRAGGKWYVITPGPQGAKHAAEQLGCKPCSIEDAGRFFELSEPGKN